MFKTSSVSSVVRYSSTEYIMNHFEVGKTKTCPNDSQMLVYGKQVGYKRVFHDHHKKS